MKTRRLAKPASLRYALLFMLACALNAIAGEGGENGLLKLPLEPPAQDLDSLPATSALSSLGARVKGGYVVFGVEILLKKGKEPAVLLPRERGSDLGAGLREVLVQLPGYEMHVVSTHLVEILPRGAETDPANLLNLRIANFSVTNKSAGDILNNPRRYIPELAARLTQKGPPRTRGPQPDGGLYSLGWLVTLHLQNCTLREILNRVTEATEHLTGDGPPLGWAYKVNSDDTPGVPKHTWQSLSGIPSDWRSYRRDGADLRVVRPAGARR